MNRILLTSSRNVYRSLTSTTSWTMFVLEHTFHSSTPPSCLSSWPSHPGSVTTLSQTTRLVSPQQCGPASFRSLLLVFCAHTYVWGSSMSQSSIASCEPSMLVDFLLICDSKILIHLFAETCPYQKQLWNFRPLKIPNCFITTLHIQISQNSF